MPYIPIPKGRGFTARLVMQMAQATGIKTVPFALLLIPSQSSYAYITKRIDRVVGDNAGMLAMEDFCQLDGKLTENKYLGSYERCGKIITRYSVQSGLDLSELYIRVVFSFVVGNSDMHLKNFSLIETDVGSSQYVLSAAYDLLSTNVILPTDLEQFALAMNRKKRNIKRNDFLHFGETIGISRRSAEKIIEKIISYEEKYIQMCADSYLPEDMKENMIALIHERSEYLRK